MKKNPPYIIKNVHAAAITVFREEEEAIAATADDSFAPTAGAFVVVLPAFVAAAVVVVGVVESPAAPPGISVLFKSSMAPSGAPSGFVPAPGFIVPFVLMSTLMLTTKSVLLPSKPKPATARHVVTFVPIFSKFVGLKDNRLGGAGSVSQTLSPSKMYLLKVMPWNAGTLHFSLRASTSESATLTHVPSSWRIDLLQLRRADVACFASLQLNFFRAAVVVGVTTSGRGRGSGMIGFSSLLGVVSSAPPPPPPPPPPPVEAVEVEGASGGLSPGISWSA